MGIGDSTFSSSVLDKSDLILFFVKVTDLENTSLGCD
jgi:hypothetical protein